MHGAVTEQPGQGGTVELGAVDHPPAPARLEVLQLDDHVEVRSVAAAGPALLVIEEEPAHLDEGVGPACGEADGKILIPVWRSQAQGGSHHCATLGVECRIKDPAVIQRP